MIELFDDLPGDTLGIRLNGKIEAQDYTEVLIPASRPRTRPTRRSTCWRSSGRNTTATAWRAVGRREVRHTPHARAGAASRLSATATGSITCRASGRCSTASACALFGMAELDQAKAWVGQAARTKATDAKRRAAPKDGPSQGAASEESDYARLGIFGARSATLRSPSAGLDDLVDDRARGLRAGLELVAQRLDVVLDTLAVGLGLLGQVGAAGRRSASRRACER